MLNLPTPHLRAVMFATLAVSAGACVDAGARFEAYGQRIPIDAPGVDAVDAPVVDTIPNIDGTWLIAVDPKPFAPGALIQILVTWDVTSSAGTGTLDGSYQPLTTFNLAPDSPARTPIGAAITANDVVVDNTAAFAANLVGTLPGPANTASGTEYPINITLHGTIRSTTSVCGTVTGSVGPLTDITGSTFAAVPSGAPLPSPIGECPAVALDAGVDALPVDAP